MEDGNFLYVSAAVSDRGLSEKRPVNEDSYLEDRRLGLFVVADGVGGAQAGDFASQMAIETIADVFSNLPDNYDTEEAMALAIRYANQAIYTAARDLPRLSTMATTIAAVNISGNIATIAHVGDSRVYRVAPDGTLYRETADHSVVEEEVRAGRMTPEQALSHPSRNVISRALGAEQEVNPDLKTIMVEPGTIFLLCTDGITRHVSDEELSRLFHNEIDPDVICSRLKEICFSRGAEDNLTAVVVRISSALAPVLASSGLNTGKSTDIQHSDAANGSAGLSYSFPDTSEEDTIASARPETETYSQENEFETIAKQSQTEDFADLREEFSDEPVTEQITAENVSDFGPAQVVVPAQASVTEESPSPLPFTESAGKRSSTGFGSLLLSFFLVLLGAAAGAAVYHFVVPPQVTEVPRLVEMKSGNIPLSEFEEARREVDKAPDRYLAANAATPQNAEDHYLLGRALLLTGKYVEAKKQFLLAKDMLRDTVEVNAKTLETDIAMGLLIADNPELVANLKKSLESQNSEANTNSGNSNTAAKNR